MTKLQTTIIDLSQKILDYLLDYKSKNPEFTFSLRERDSAQSAGVKRLSVGYWFQGSTYIYVPLFGVGDNARKVKTVGFVITFDEVGNIIDNYIEISFKGGNYSSDELTFHTLLAAKINLNLSKSNNGKKSFDDRKDIWANLEYYIKDFRDYAITLLNQFNLNEKYIISEKNFQKRLQKIKEIQARLLLPPATPETTNQNSDGHKKYQGNLNQILYGPPGTGKTHKMKHHYLPFFIQNQHTVSKEEYTIDRVSKLTWWEVIALTLYTENKPMTVPEIKAHPFVIIKLNVSNTVSLDQTIWGQLSQHTIESSKTVVYSKRTFPLIFDKTLQSVWSIVRTELVQHICDLGDKIKNYKDISGTKNNFDFITFHQSYAYEDFIEGIKPNLTDPSQESSEVDYIMKDGIFYKSCDEAAKLAGFSSLWDCLSNFSKEERMDRFSKAAPYALFIDEINRGNVSAIFGELITLIESDKRLTKDEIILRLPYSNRKFSVPPNLYIIGTMNTADRSVESLDTALRRRFCFEEMMPESDLLTPSAIYCRLLWKYEVIDWEEEPYASAEKDLFDLLGAPQSFIDERKAIWEEMKKEKTPLNLTYFDSYNSDFTGVNLYTALSKINSRIEMLYDRDHTIGHSYFLNVFSERDLRNVFQNSIIPLLQEYFYGDYEKIGWVIGQEFFQEPQKDVKGLFDSFFKSSKPDVSMPFKMKDMEEVDIMGALKKLSNRKNDIAIDSELIN